MYSKAESDGIHDAGSDNFKARMCKVYNLPYKNAKPETAINK